jgi:hypothetical protein
MCNHVFSAWIKENSLSKCLKSYEKNGKYFDLINEYVTIANKSG